MVISRVMIGWESVAVSNAAVHGDDGLGNDLVLTLQRDSERDIGELGSITHLTEVCQGYFRYRCGLGNVVDGHVLPIPPLSFNNLAVGHEHLPPAFFQITPELPNIDPPIRVPKSPHPFSFIIDELALVLSSLVVKDSFAEDFVFLEFSCEDTSVRELLHSMPFHKPVPEFSFIKGAIAPSELP